MEIVQNPVGKGEGEEEEEEPGIVIEGEEGAAIEEEEAEHEKEVAEEAEEKTGLTIEGVEVGDEPVRADEQPPEDVAMGQNLELIITELFKRIQEKSGEEPPEELAQHAKEDAKKDSTSMIKELRIKFVQDDIITKELADRGKVVIEARLAALEKFIEASEFVRTQELEISDEQKKVEEKYKPVLLELRRKVIAAKKTGEDVSATKATIKNIEIDRNQKRTSMDVEFGAQLAPFRKRLEMLRQSLDNAEKDYALWRDDVIIMSVKSMIEGLEGAFTQKIEDLYAFYILKVKQQRDGVITISVLLLWIDIISDTIATIVNGFTERTEMDLLEIQLEAIEKDLNSKVKNREIPQAAVERWVAIENNALGLTAEPEEAVAESAESAIEEQKEELAEDRDDQLARKHDSVQKIAQTEAGLLLLSELSAADSTKILCPIVIQGSPQKRLSTPPPPAMVPISQALEKIPGSIKRVSESVTECPTEPVISKGISKVASPRPMMDELGITPSSPQKLKMCVICGETDESYAIIMEGKTRKKRKKKEGEEEKEAEYGIPKIEWRTLNGRPACNACYKAIIKQQKELKDKIIEDAARREAAISQAGEKRRAKREQDRKEAEQRRQGILPTKRSRKKVTPKKVVTTIPMRISPPKPPPPEKEKTPSPEPPAAKKTRVKTPPKPIVIDISPEKPKQKKSIGPPTDEEMAERIRAYKARQAATQPKVVLDLTAACEMGDGKRRGKK